MSDRWGNGSCDTCGYNPCRCWTVLDDIGPPKQAWLDVLAQMHAMLGGAMEGVLRALVYDHGVHWRQLSIANTTQDPMYRRVIVLEEGTPYVAGHVHGYFGGPNGWRFRLDARAYPRDEWRA